MEGTESGAGIKALIAEIRQAFDRKNGSLAPGLDHKVMGYGLDGNKAWEVRQLCLTAASALQAQQAKIDELERALKLTGGVARKAVAELETG